MRIQWIVGLFVLFIHFNAQARVYRYVKVGEYATSFELSAHKGKSFLSLMKETIYPALLEESVPRFNGQHFDGVKKGIGVELRLTPTVTTYHVKYEAHWEEEAERSGRSFAGVDHKPWNKKTEYVADASYKHYLSTLEKFLAYNPEEVEDFYLAVFKIILNCDPSGVADLSVRGQQVLADFVAVYVAEQYRHLISGKGKKLGRKHNWDNAHLQVTLLAAFHSGQAKHQKAMFYKGRFVDQVIEQKSKGLCLYRTPWEEIPDNHKTRSMNLTDYWQFNQECERSGVNITRRDFRKLGRTINYALMNHPEGLDPREFNRTFKRRWTSNFIEAFTRSIISNRAPDQFKNWEERSRVMLEWLMKARDRAPKLTEEWLQP